jgi:hypothetical protein
MFLRSNKRLPAALLRQLLSQTRGAPQANTRLALLSRMDSLVGVAPDVAKHQGKRHQSSAAAVQVAVKTDTTTPLPSISIPFRHSIKAPPKVLRHRQKELDQSTEQLLTASPGTLYQYQDAHTTRDDAWKAAESTVQLAEYVLRGHASWIPGSIYYKKTKNQETSLTPLTVAQHVAQMQAILTRLEQEGQVYMQLRHERLAQKFQEKQMEQVLPTKMPMPMEEEEGEATQLPTLADTTKQFAPPGPTVKMYDVLLDSMAVMAAAEPDATVTPTSMTPIKFITLLRQIHAAHTLDGGDAINTNPATFPTMQSFNATLRGIASCKFSGEQQQQQQQQQDELIRDQAMEAFGIYNSMAHTTSERLKRNSATITYMLQIVTKFIPTSRTKGNIAFSIFMQATKEGIVDTDSRVQQAYKETNAPSNGVEFDDLVHERCAPDFVLPTKWIRHSKNRRHDAMVGTTNIY